MDTYIYQEKSSEKRLELIFKLLDKNYNTAIILQLSEKAIQLSDSLRNREKKALALERSGMAYNAYGDHFKASERLNESLEMYQSLGNLDGVNAAKRSLGETYRAARNYPLAMKSLQESLDYFLEKKDSVMLARIYNRMAATLFEIIFLETEGVEVKKEFREPDSKTSLMFDKDPAWKQYKDSLMNYIHLANELAISKQRYDLVISTEIIHAAYFTYTAQYEEAVRRFQGIIEIIEDSGLYEDLPLVFYNLAMLHLPNYLNQPETSMEFAKMAIEESRNLDIKAYEYMGFNVLHQAYAAQGEYQNAYESVLEVLENLKIFTADELEIKLKTQEIEYKLAQNEIELRSRRNQLWIVWIATFLIVLSFSGFTYILNRRNKKKQALMEELNRKNLMISEQNQELEKINAEKDKFFGIIAHDLRGPFATIIGFSKILEDEVQNQNYAEIGKTSKLISESAEKAMNLLTNLMHWTLSKTKRLDYYPETINLNQLVRENISLLSETAKQKRIDLQQDILENIQVFTDRNMLNTVFRNLISNALKFTRPGGAVSVMAVERTNDVLILVKDNGIGMDSKEAATIFNLDRKTGRKGTGGEPSTGLGLILCKEFIELMGGKIWIESQEEKGTIVYFSLPLEKINFS
ncbi:tetratricopeptide repeat-containing sensor histidine kinase [Arthrospiribacter ruber]|uniref:ATP-binding protein n=1 Tax=Arthrospiribacter ruber TaxID=2487934 RepID=UPI001C5BA0D7|nr:tetratricopeptide repeat-containing sensor histidine kinase [Arthrospiribacter ruber]